MYLNYPDKYFRQLDFMDNFEEENLNNINLDNAEDLNIPVENTIQSLIEEIDNEFVNEMTSMS
ncbi:MAG: hypothetical protein K0R54_1907 [Clostridiaceae bacterium]|jgi:hypothetical protein|nr:hypothetical protein [Clostridiaceae bacterium]